MGTLVRHVSVVCFSSICVLLVALASSAGACETPVYRYAMYRWQPAPYEIYYFHDEPASEEDQSIHELLIEAERSADAKANVALIPINTKEDPELASVPPDVKKAWEERGEKTLPSYFISTPYGVGLSFTNLDKSSVNSLIESPARKSLAAQLETGKLGVFVMLSGKDSAENEATEKILNGLVEEVRNGKISLYVSPSDVPAEEKASTKPDFDVGLLKVDRESDEEQWFVRSLLAMEPDLADEERPMVFLVYGRARALLPYIGKGITRENLVREIEFVSGACSCTVKEQNPGVDLLVKYDWESAAASLAEKFGSEEGNESQFGPEMFFPELIIPDNAAPETTELASEVDSTQNDEIVTDNTIIEQTDVEVESVESGDTESEVATAQTDEAVEPASIETEVDTEINATPTGPEVATITPSETTSTSRSTGSVETSYTTSVWIVGAGIGVALLVLFGLTFVVLRPQ